jgi:flagellar hook-length control protein FliK
MSGFLLSSVSVKELNSSSVSPSSKGVGEASVGLLVNGSSDTAKQANGFSNILSSIDNLASDSKADLRINKELFASIETMSNNLEQYAPDSGALLELSEFLNGQTMSTLNLESNNDGASLPEFLSKLESMLNSILKDIEDGGKISESEGFDEDLIVSLQAAYSQLMGVINNTANKTAEVVSASSSSLLGFSFNGGKGREGQWQQYDPQQASSGLQKTSQSEPQQIIQPEQKTLHSQSVLTDHLISETDKNFKAQMQQIMPDTTHTASDVADLLSDSSINTQDKAVLKFSDIQLRPVNDGFKPYSTTLTTPVQSQQWSDEVSQKIVWFTGRNIQAAEMHLNPADLGPIDVKIHVQNDVTTVTFNAHHASVRDLLESNVVRLREMMESNGVNVGDVNVDSGSREQSQHSGSDSESKGFGQSGQGGTEHTELAAGEQEIVLKQTNLVDYFV